MVGGEFQLGKLQKVQKVKLKLLTKSFQSLDMYILAPSVDHFLKMGQSRPLFVYFRPFPITTSTIQIEKSIGGLLGIQTCSRRMVGADETTEHSFVQAFKLVEKF